MVEVRCCHHVKVAVAAGCLWQEACCHSREPLAAQLGWIWALGMKGLEGLNLLVMGYC
jgi:hypothetical protein